MFYAATADALYAFHPRTAMSSLRPSAPTAAAALPKVQRYWAGAEPAYAAPAAGDANAGPQLSAASVLAARARPTTNMKLSGAKASGRKPRAEIVMAGEDDDEDAAPVVRRKPPTRAGGQCHHGVVQIIFFVCCCSFIIALIIIIIFIYFFHC